MDEIREKILENYEVQIAASFSCVEILDALYGVTCEGIMGEDDIFILSKGHAAPAQYTILAMKGVIPWDQLAKYGPYVHYEAPGMPFTTGSLGCGLGLGAGVALGKRLKGDKGRVYVLCGDGELYEGSIWEAVRFAGEMELGNLTLIVDHNKKACIEQDVKNPRYLFSPYRWANNRVLDGHNLEHVQYWLSGRACSPDKWKRPTVFIVDTIKGQGFQELIDDPLRHVRRVVDGRII